MCCGHGPWPSRPLAAPQVASRGVVRPAAIIGASGRWPSPFRGRERHSYVFPTWRLSAPGGGLAPRGAELAGRATSAVGHRLGRRVVRHLEAPALAGIEPGSAALDAVEDLHRGGPIDAQRREHQFPLTEVPEVVHAPLYSAIRLQCPPGPLPSLSTGRMARGSRAPATIAVSRAAVERLWNLWIRWKRSAASPPDTWNGSRSCPLEG